MEFIISFPGNAFSDIADAYQFGDCYSLFEKTAVLWNNRRDCIDYGKDVVQSLVQASRRTYTLMEQNSLDLDFGSTVIYRYEHHKWLHIFHFNVIDETQLDMERLLKDAARRNFSFAYKADTLKYLWQNEIIPGNFETLGRGRSHQHLPKWWDPHLSPVLGELIDISVNPGHSIETFGMSLMAAPEMWFGPYSWKYFNCRELESFTGATVIKQLNDAVVYVRLFDSEIPNYEVPEVLQLQKKFRDWIAMDKVEEILQAKIVWS